MVFSDVYHPISLCAMKMYKINIDCVGQSIMVRVRDSHVPHKYSAPGGLPVESGLEVVGKIEVVCFVLVKHLA